MLRAVAQLLHEVLNPQLDAGALALIAGRQLDQDFDASHSAGVVDRLRPRRAPHQEVRREAPMSPWPAERLPERSDLQGVCAASPKINWGQIAVDIDRFRHS